MRRKKVGRERKEKRETEIKKKVEGECKRDKMRGEEHERGEKLGWVRIEEIENEIRWDKRVGGERKWNEIDKSESRMREGRIEKVEC